MRLGWCLVLGSCAGLLGTACVDGTTPDCSTPSSGCYPVDAAGNDGQTDASDASSEDGSDGSPIVDAADAGDAGDATGD